MNVVSGSLVGMWAVAAPCLVFLACVYFTRAPIGRAVAALLSGVAVAAVSIAVDVLAHRCGWWRYPGMGNRSFGPIVWYVGAGIGVSGLTLIGWRAHRRWGLRGTIAFLLVLAVYGAARDWAVSHATRDVIVFGVGALPWIADYAAWLACASVAVTVQSFLRGPPNQDAPRARRTDQERKRQS